MKRILGFVLSSLVITLIIALVLIFTQGPKPFAETEGLDFSQQLGVDIPAILPEEEVEMRDGFALWVRRYAAQKEDVPLLIILHGSAWHGMQFHALAQQFGDVAEVLVPDLRGHGAAPATRGDIDYIGQFEDDIADLIKASKAEGQKLILAGHSSGGGLVTRFAGGEHGGLLDGAVLMAPFLKHNAPTTRQDSGGWAHARLRRIIGLSMLNTFRITALNHLPIIDFNMPRVARAGRLGATATTSYSYRLNTSFAPRSDYLADVAALPEFLLVSGSQDEAFFSEKYAATMMPVTDRGRYVIIDGVTHLEVVNAPETARAIRAFLSDFQQ